MPFNKHLDIIINERRKYKIRNIIDIISRYGFGPEDVIIVIDGDDWVKEDCIEKVISKYKSGKYDYIYTNWEYSHNQEIGISKPIPNDDWNPYANEWRTSALSSFKVGLWNKINKKNFLDISGNFFKVACDQAYILPMLEILRTENNGYSRVGFINEPLYVYQFNENPHRLRLSENGVKDSYLGSVSSKFIRHRGFIP